MPELGLTDVQLLEYSRTISEDGSYFQPFPESERDLEDDVPWRSAQFLMIMMMMMVMIVKKCLLENFQAFLDLDTVAQEIQTAVMVEDTQVISPNLLSKTCRKLVATEPYDNSLTL
jgi:hypothetical protein